MGALLHGAKMHRLDGPLVCLSTSYGMDVEVLLSSIQAVPAIWDASHPKHFDRGYINTQWSLISDALGISGKY